MLLREDIHCPGFGSLKCTAVQKRMQDSPVQRQEKRRLADDTTRENNITRRRGSSNCIKSKSWTVRKMQLPEDSLKAFGHSVFFGVSLLVNSKQNWQSELVKLPAYPANHPGMCGFLLVPQRMPQMY